MERPLTLKPLSIQDENSTIHRKKVSVDGKSKSSKPVAKKGGLARESRKALNDITNKSSINLEASSKPKNSQNRKCNTVDDGYLHRHFEAESLSKKKSAENEKLNIAEECFLHDHSKCIEAQKPASEQNFWDTVLPGHDTVNLTREEAQIDPKLEELSMSEFSDLFKSCWKSPPSSPISCDSHSHSAFAWDLEPFELMLKEDDHDDIR